MKIEKSDESKYDILLFCPELEGYDLKDYRSSLEIDILEIKSRKVARQCFSRIFKKYKNFFTNVYGENDFLNTALDKPRKISKNSLDKFMSQLPEPNYIYPHFEYTLSCYYIAGLYKMAEFSKSFLINDWEAFYISISQIVECLHQKEYRPNWTTLEDALYKVKKEIFRTINENHSKLL